VSVRRRWLVLAAVLVAAAGAGLFLLGRATAGGSSSPGGYYDGYFAGLRAGEAQGREEGRAEQEVAELPAGDRARTSKAFRDGYTAGFNDAFAGYDGGWTTGEPYVVVLEPGAGQVVYRIATREVIKPGFNYYRCSAGLCTGPR
jgi:hypothetical protein